MLYNAHETCTKGVATWELSKWNVILYPIMHGKCTIHAQKGYVGGMKLIL